MTIVLTLTVRVKEYDRTKYISRGTVMVAKAIKDFAHDSAHTDYRHERRHSKPYIGGNSLITQKEAETKETSG